MSTFDENVDAITKVIGDLTRRAIKAEDSVIILQNALRLIGTMDYPRPCDCERCTCGNIGDATDVAAWDAENRVRHEARAALAKVAT